MIVVMSKIKSLAEQLRKELGFHGVDCEIQDHSKADSFEALYQPDVVAVVVDSMTDHIHQQAWHDLLSTLGRRIPVISIFSKKEKTDFTTLRNKYAESIAWLESPDVKQIIGILDSCGAIGIDHRKLERTSIPVFNPQVPLHMLQNNGSLSVIAINASSFRNIAIEYGSDAYRRVQDCFHQMLFDLWGTQGSFRSADILVRRSEHSNQYFIFLEQSRAASSIPAPGVLEKLADRLSIKLQNTFWEELFKPRSKKIMPSCITVIPDIAIGFATSIYNPCVDAVEHVEKLLESAANESKVQLKRMRDRHRELMQTLIQTPDLLVPNYQCVFSLPDIKKDDVTKANQLKSLQPLADHIFGFESLIRVRKEAVDAAMNFSGLSIIDSKFLRPDTLFSMANTVKLSLELDQACLYHAVLNSADLDGVLMVNILPRNLYYIDRLKHLIMDRRQIMFEVSESEAINNFDLMMQVRESISANDMFIATDDFGRGYAGLEQIIKIRPDLIKLDRSLIQDIHCDNPKQAFVEGLIRAAKLSNTKILAEGVECWEEAEILQKLGVEYIQGFLLHKPQPVEEILLDLQQAPQTLDTVA